MGGDVDAFGSLYVRHLDAIFRYIYYRIGEEAEAEDLTEEVFARAWEALPGYRAREYPFTSWLYRIAHNLVVDHHRRKKSLPANDLESRMTQNRRAHEDQLVHDQEASLLAEGIRLLPEEEQQVLTLRFVEGLSHREVAVIIGKSEGASRVIQHRALTRLSEFLEAREFSPA
jgi:RNA polymerase sigma-70 factor (ECF subfamily)